MTAPNIDPMAGVRMLLNKALTDLRNNCTDEFLVKQISLWINGALATTEHIAAPTIELMDINAVLEEAAKIADQHTYGPCGEYDFSYDDASSKADDRAEQIAKSIRSAKIPKYSTDKPTKKN